MKYCTGILAVLSVSLITACASVEKPKPDPIKEELSILQKQLLELQRLQNDTKAKLDESTAAINNLSVKIMALEERQVLRPASRSQIASKPAIIAADKKTPVPKKKTKKAKTKVRRQE